MGETTTVYFSLRTRNQQEKTETNRIIKQLKETFGEESVTVSDYDLWKSVLINNANCWVGVNDIGYYGKSRLHIFRDMGEQPNLNFDVPLEDCDTIF